jgi:hypothetical protein
LLNRSEQRIKFHSETLIAGAGVANEHHESIRARFTVHDAGWSRLRNQPGATGSGPGWAVSRAA